MKFLARFSFHYALGHGLTGQFWNVVNIVLVTVAASEKIKHFLHYRIEHTSTLLGAVVAAYVGGTWLVGWTLDRFDFMYHYHDNLLGR